MSEANLVELGRGGLFHFFLGGKNGTCNMMMQKTDGCYGVLENSQFISVCVFKCCCFSSAWDTEQDRTMQDVKECFFEDLQLRVVQWVLSSPHFS